METPGLPPNTAKVYCPNNRPGNTTATRTRSCYLLNDTTDSFAAHDAACKAMGGYLAGFNSAAEQLDVEAKLGLWSKSTNIWLGVYPGAGQQWYLADGTLVGNGQPSNAAPYAHWWVRLARCLLRVCWLLHHASGAALGLPRVRPATQQLRC
jgi:hypothetical protein